MMSLNDASSRQIKQKKKKRKTISKQNSFRQLGQNEFALTLESPAPVFHFSSPLNAGQPRADEM